jgi:hypothetical protein
MADWTGQRNGPDYTVDILKKANKGFTTPQVEQEDPVAAAKRFLTNTPSTEGTVNDIADMEARLAWNQQNAQMGQDIAQKRKGGLRRATEGLSRAGDIASGASMATLPLALAGLPEVSGGAMALGGLLHTPDALRRAYAGETDEALPGVGEAIGTGLELSPLAGLVGLLGKGGQVGGEMAGSKVGRMAGPSRYDSAQGIVESPNFQRASNPNQVLGVGREIARETSTPLVDVLRGGRKAGLGNQQSVKALMQLSESGPAARAAAAPKQAIRQMNRESELRTVRGIGNLQREAPGGLSDLAAGKIKPEIYRPLQSQADAILKRGVGPETELMGELSPLDKTARQARARERFGRVFQMEGGR